MYPGISNTEISLYYQYIRDIDKASAAFGEHLPLRMEHLRELLYEGVSDVSATASTSTAVQLPDRLIDHIFLY